MKTKSVNKSVSLSLAVVLMSAVSSHATIVLPATLGDLVREAHSVARGRVAAVEDGQTPRGSSARYARRLPRR